MKVRLFITLVLFSCLPLQAQRVLTLEECEDLALENNSLSKIARERVRGAEYEQKAAFANYLPKVSALGAYLRNNSETALISADQSAALTNMGTTLQGKVSGAIVKQLLTDPTLQSLYATNPTLQYLLGMVQNADVATPLNQIGQLVSDELHPDLRNIYVGTVSFEEPLYAGGKIRSYNKVTAYASQLARTQLEGEDRNVVVTTHEAYWQIVSVAHKVKLTEKLVELLEELCSNVEKMKEQGVATESDLLSVRVRLNEAELLKLKAGNGLILSKMLLCQLCGLELDSPITLEDELNEDLTIPSAPVTWSKSDLLELRPELKSLNLATKMYGEKVNIIRADYLPTVALMGNVIVMNPSVSNGFQKKTDTFYNVGVVAKLPIYHFGEGLNKVRKAKSDAIIARYQLDQAEGLVQLQVSQYEQRITEADTRMAAVAGLKNTAAENLRMAQIGFREGVTSQTDLLAAQTAWFQARSEEIDARIERIMADVYLRQAVGRD